MGELLDFCSCLLFSSRSNASFNENFILAGVVSDIVFRTTIENAGPNTAYNLVLTFTHPTVLAYSRVDSGAQFTCETDLTRTVTSCTVTNALAARGKVGGIDRLSLQWKCLTMCGHISYLFNICPLPPSSLTSPFSVHPFLHPTLYRPTLCLLSLPVSLVCPPPPPPPPTPTFPPTLSSRTIRHP